MLRLLKSQWKKKMNRVIKTNTCDILLSHLRGLIPNHQLFIKAMPCLSIGDGFTAGAANANHPTGMEKKKKKLLHKPKKNTLPPSIVKTEWSHTPPWGAAECISPQRALALSWGTLVKGERCMGYRPSCLAPGGLSTQSRQED